MFRGSILITTKVILALMLIDFSTALQCSSAIAHLPDYTCYSEEFFGKGASGEAFRVHKDGVDYILKAQHIKDPEDRDQALTDLKYLMMFRGYPYLAQLVESKQTPDYLFEVLEFGKNGNLENYYGRDKEYFQDWKLTLEFFLKLLKAIATMHSKNVVHADIKMPNIVVSKDIDPILIDFDLSVPKDVLNFGRGTNNYMDPVIMKAWGKHKTVYNEFRDIYSLGVTLYYLTQGDYPFAGSLRNEIFDNISQHSYVFNKGTHVETAKIIHSCLRLEEADRKSIKELIDMTEAALAQKSDIVLSEDKVAYNNEPLHFFKTKLTLADYLKSQKGLTEIVLWLAGILVLIGCLVCIGNKNGWFSKNGDIGRDGQQIGIDGLNHALDQQA
jgi:serine/threonine protein kinase